MASKGKSKKVRWSEKDLKEFKRENWRMRLEYYRKKEEKIDIIEGRIKYNDIEHRRLFTSY